MRSTFRLPTGNTYCGGWRKCAIELPCLKDSNIGNAGLIVGTTVFITGFLLISPRGPYILPPLLNLMLPYRFAFIAMFGLHFAKRYTLMDPARRKQAVAVFAVTAPVLFFVPIQFTLLCLLRPTWTCRAIKAWFCYPPVVSPGHWRAPIDNPKYRLLLSLCLLDWPQALLCILPLTFVVKEDEEPTFQRLFSALRNSPFAIDREMVLLGLHAHDGAPILFHWTKFKTHALFLGKTGSCKTSSMLLLMHQLMIIRPDLYVGFLDGKAYTAEVLAEMFASGKEVKWFTVDNGKSTYVFNPIDQSWYRNIPRAFRAEFWTAALNADSGNDYGHLFYTIGALVNLIRPTRRNPRDIEGLRRGIEKEGGNNRLRKELKGAGAMMQGIMEVLAMIQPLRGKSTIDLTEEIRRGRCIYFALPANMIPISTRFIGGIFLQSHIRAVSDLPPGFKGWLFIDELQRFAGRNVEMFLQLARSHGLSVIVGLPSPSDAVGQVSDVAESAMNNADFEWIFTAWGRREQMRVGDMAGETIELLTSYKPIIEMIPTTKTRHHGRWQSGDGPTSLYTHTQTSSVINGEPKPQIAWYSPSYTEQVVSRLNVNEMNYFSAMPTTSMFQAKAAEYFGALNTMRHFYHIDEATFLKRERMPWPAGNTDTIIPTDIDEDLLPPESPEPPKSDDDEPPFTPHRTKKPRK